MLLGIPLSMTGGGRYKKTCLANNLVAQAHCMLVKNEMNRALGHFCVHIG